MKAIGRRGTLLLAISVVGVLGASGTASAASIGTTELDFGSQPVGIPSAPQALSVSPGQTCIPGGPFGDVCVPNPTDVVSGIGVTGPFAQTNTCLLFAPCTINVLFLPVSQGPANGTLTADGDTVALRGFGGSGGAGGGVLQASQASNSFSFGGVKLNKNNGTATLTVDVPGAGNVALGGNGVVKQRPAAGASASKVTAKAGTVKLKVKAKGKKKAKLNQTGKAKVKAKVTFTPTGGVPATQTKKIKLKKTL